METGNGLNSRSTRHNFRRTGRPAVDQHNHRFSARQIEPEHQPPVRVLRQCPRTEHAHPVECEMVVNAAGMWGMEVGRMFMKLTPGRYAHDLLVERLHVVEVVVGVNFTFSISFTICPLLR